MHLLLLAWDVDHPGRLDPHVVALARALIDGGAACEVVTLGTGPTSTRTLDGVPVTWVPEAPPVLPDTPDYDLPRVLAAASRASAAAERRCQERAPDAVLALGWTTTWTATALRATRGTPVVAMLDSTAAQRGDLDGAGRLVAQVEWWLTYEARRVVAPDPTLARELRRAYRLPGDKVDVVPPGTTVPDVPDVARGHVGIVGPTRTAGHVRAALARPWQVEVVDGPTLPARTPEVVVVVDEDRRDLAVDAMAAGAVVVVPDGGPLQGLVHADRTGIRTGTSPGAVARTVIALTSSPARLARLGERAHRRARDEHAWPTVVDRLLDVVRAAVREEAALHRSERDARSLRPILLRSPLVAVDGDATRPNARHGPKGQG